MRHVKRIIVLFSGLLGVYALLGFLVLPLVLEAVLPDKLGEVLNRPVRVKKIRLNPLQLTLEVAGVDIREKNGKDPFVSFEGLFVDVNGTSLLKKGLVIDGARLEKPAVHLARMDGGAFNFSDLTAGSDEAAEKDKDAATTPFRFAVKNIQINKGSLVYRDLPLKKDHVLSDLRFSLPLISNFAEHAEIPSQARLSAVIDGAKLSADAKTRPFATPFEVDVDLDLAEARVPHYFGYVPKDAVNIDIPAGLLDIRASVQFKNAKAPELMVQGDVGLTDLTVTDRKAGPVLALSKLSVAVAPSRPLANSLHLEAVTLQKPVVTMSRNREGVLNLAALGSQPSNAKAEKAEPATNGEDAPPAPDKNGTQPAPQQKPKGFDLKIKTLALDGGRVAFTDEAPSAQADTTAENRAPASPAAFQMDELTIRIKDFSLAPERITRFDLKTRVNREGEIAASGGFGLSPVSVEGDFSIKGLHLAWAKPYIPASVQPEIGDGILSADGKAFLKPAGDAGLGVTVTGNAAINDLFMAGDKPETTADLTFSGTVENAPLAVEGDFAASNLPLAWGRPYIPDTVKLDIKTGLLSADGSLSLKTAETGKLGATVSGKAMVRDFVSLDSSDQKAFASFDTFAVEGVNISTDPLSIDMDRILLKKPKHRFVLLEPGVSNVSKVFATPETPAGPRPADSGKKETPVPFSIGEVVIQDGDFRFTDRTIDPDYSTRLDLNELRVTGLTSRQFKSAWLSAEGVIDSQAPVKITGEVNPFKEDLFVDVDLNLSNMELSPLSPYTGKFIGQTIGKGKLTTSVLFKIEKNTLSIQNKVLVDQLTLGRKVASPMAVDLPLGMAIALLKDRSGKIDIHLPVSGRTDDPKFSIFKIVWNAFKKLIVKAAASPFDLVSGIVGGGESLRYIEFAPGSADIDAAGETKLASVAKVMFERPGLNMDLTGYVDAAKDRAGLAEARLDRELKTAKIKDQGTPKAPGQGQAEMDLSPEEYANYVKALYAEKAGRGRDKALPIPDMAAWLKAQWPVSDQDLRKLAILRARMVKAALSKDRRIASDRLFLNEAGTLAPKKIKGFGAARVELAIR